MKIFKSGLFLFLVICSISVRANNVQVGTSLGFHESNYLFSLSGGYHWSFVSDQLKVGVGARHTSFFGNKYKTVPVTGGTGQFIDIQDPSVHSLNAAFFTSFTYNNFAVGFNIDLFGLSYGSDKESHEFSNGLSGKPASTNMLKGGAKDEGSLNSEFWFGYVIDPNMLIRLGFSHYVAEYETTQADSTGNKRFREFNDFIFVGFSYDLK